jgi:tetratricopeptide (TPR) repeat protein
MALLGSLLRLEERHDESERMLREVLETRRRVLGAEHPDTMVSTSQLAGTLLQEGRSADAEKMLREILAIQRRTLDPDNPDMAISMYNLACVLARGGRRAEAISLLREAIDHGLPPNPRARMANDPDLQALHGDSRFAAIVAQAQKTGEASSASNSPR